MFSTISIHAIKSFCQPRHSNVSSHRDSSTALTCTAQAQVLEAAWGAKAGAEAGRRTCWTSPSMIPMFGRYQVPSSGPAPPVYTTRPALITLWLKQGLWAMAEKFCSPKSILVIRKCNLLWLQGKGPLSLMALSPLRELGSAKNLCSGNTLLTLEDSRNTHL